MSFRFSARSRRNLAGLHADLVGVAEAALARTPIDFMVTEGLRSRERQAALVRAGASRTLNSRHLTGHALDVAAWVDGQVRWDWPLYPPIAQAFKAAAAERNVSLIWGGDWPTLRDGPHFELDQRRYP
ncbi:M15 family peptidase [Brevundimonas sp. S30B]|uniref:M15 family metallopeptidase n=1 Tax=unclassified Brevundimonas TaxID=2622653 RepID=UPI001072A3CF|nr:MULTISPECIES: M15 family metallopeptidase [unclassified Brevundimonas]QBX38598.1 M15 family peptidase [Brevundimonas sp. MF30-B]TFW01189.1 M15 family peptidase [Brevundimonas sp. S30B]